MAMPTKRNISPQALDHFFLLFVVETVFIRTYNVRIQNLPLFAVHGKDPGKGNTELVPAPGRLSGLVEQWPMVDKLG